MEQNSTKPKLDGWKYRRRVVFGVVLFCMLCIGYVLWNGLDTSPAEAAVTMAFFMIGSTVGSYVFGAVWEDRKKHEIGNYSEGFE